MQKYIFREYNPEYRDFFISEKRKILNILGTKIKIEHVGSTAVLGLGGKGILDIVVSVPKSKFAKSKEKLEKGGYEFKEKASYPERLFFRIDYPYKKRKRRVHVHLTVFNSRDWKGMIGFRNYLLKHSNAVRRYTEIKKEAVRKAHGNGKKYRQYKENFIENILSNIST